MNEEELKNKISMALKDPILQQGFEIICKELEELEKDNAELKKNYEDSLVACGVLKAKVDTLAQPSPLESMQDVLITTQKAQNEKQREQLTKAKELLKWFVWYFREGSPNLVPYKHKVEEAEQFLNSEVEK